MQILYMRLFWTVAFFFDFFYCLFSGFEVSAQLVLMLEYPVQTAIQPVFGRYAIIGIEQLVHRGLVKPLPVEIKLAAWMYEAIYHQQIEHL